MAELENGYTIGVVIHFDRLKRYGFIAPIDADEPEIFCHASHIVANDPHYRYVVRGQKVAYKVGEHEGRRCATNVIKLADPIIKPLRPDIKETKLFDIPGIDALGAKPTTALGTPKDGGSRER
jgi:cold shock CspA family protein